ncbi:M23 family metallopeptidase, partial [Acaryochloris marina NIES-2412]|uniref:M23 family metallopeptidase n=1 Tax=Acaryochloris marina TaxID=155978 RepID=UPI00405834D2
TGDASTNEPIGVASAGLPCRPGAIASSGIDFGAITPGDGISTGQLTHPAPGYPLTSDWGSRYINGIPSFHQGLDFGVPVGGDILAIDGGVVSDVFNECHPTGGYYKNPCGGYLGNFVRIRHANGTESVYGHLAGSPLTIGAPVTKGQVIGKGGNSGSSTGPHLHFGIKDSKGNYFDPTPYLQ